MRLRLILAFAFIVLVSVSGVVLIAGSTAANTVRAYMFRGGMIGAEGLAAALQDFYQQHGSWQGVDSFIAAWNPAKGYGYGAQGMGMGGVQSGLMHARIRLADFQGNLLVDSESDSTGGRLSNEEIANAIRLAVRKETVGYLLLEGGVNFTANDQVRLVNRLNQAALTAGLIAGGISLALVFILTYGLMRPVRELTQAVEGMANGDLTQRVKVRGNDELATLGVRFNQMAASLQQAEAVRRAMTADIAHELRNPLAVQRANLEALQDGIYPLTPENLAPILEQNQLLTRLVEDLRTLALAEAGQLSLQPTRTNIETVVEKIIERFRPQADSLGVHLRILEAEGQEMMGAAWVDRDRVEQILGNVISNALRYTPRDGFIELKVAYLPDAIGVTVRDSGPGIPADALDAIFERFYRGERSRARSEGGTGLGLTIARQLAQALGGSLSAENHPQGGAVFSLKLPCFRGAEDEIQ